VQLWMSDHHQMNNKSFSCPCGSGNNYTTCCRRYHKGKIHAPTAEALMRSRYTAYVMGDAQYIYRSWHESTRPSLQSLRDSGPQTFTTLKILSVSAGGETDNNGTVEFIATYDNNGKTVEHHENSKFRRVKGRWVYVETE